MYNLFKTLVGTIQGLDNEGSAKRVTVLFFTVVLLSSLIWVYNSALTAAYSAIAPTTIHTAIVAMFTTVLYSILLTIWVLLGLATIETITSLIKLIKGVPDKKEEVK